jgi:toxin CptA
MVAFFTGILATWLFMYGLIPFFQGPIAIAMGGVDLSWLAGGVVAAAVYAVLGPIVAARYDGVQLASPVQTPAPRTAPLEDAAPEVIA